jgi:hypothetical protein
MTKRGAEPSFRRASARRGIERIAAASCFAAALVALGACSNMIDRPVTPKLDGAARQAGISYANAVDYAEGVRTELQEGLDNTVRFDVATKVALGAGVAGGAISALFRSGSDTILGFLTLGGFSYGANQLIDPKTLAGVYLAGMSNLDCIDDAGAAAHQSVAGLQAQRDVLDGAIAAVNKDISDAVAARNARYDDVVAKAQSSVAQAKLVENKLDAYLKATPIGEAMVSGVNATITAVNKQLLEKSPNLDAIAQAGSIFGTFISANSGVKGQIQSALNTFGAKAVRSVGNDPLLDRFTKDLDALQTVLTQIPAQLDPPNVAAIARCQTQFAADAVVTVQPPGPLSLTDGDPPLRLTPTGKAPFQLLWVGPVPNDVDVNLGFNQITLTAHAGATEHTNTFRIVDFSGKSSSDVTLNVHAKGAAAKGAPGGGTGGKPAVQTEDQLVKSMTLPTLAAAIGLSSATVPSRTDPRWMARVAWLEDCVGITPPTGKVSQALLDKLKGTACVSQAPAPATPAPKAAAANAAGGGGAAPPAVVAPPVVNPAIPIPGAPDPNAGPDPNAAKAKNQ